MYALLQQGCPAVGNCHWSRTVGTRIPAHLIPGPTSSDGDSQSQNGDDEPEVEVVWAKAARGVWDWVTCSMESRTLRMTFASTTRFPNNGRCLSSPRQLHNGLETELHSPLLPRLPILSLSLNCPLNMSRRSRLFGLEKRSFTQCLWKGHAHGSDIMFQCDAHHWRCACTAAVLKCHGLVVQPPPPPGHTPARTSQCWSQQTPHGLGVCIWMHLVNGTGDSPSPGRPTHGGAKQDKSSRGSVDTTKTRSGPQRVRMSSGERPIGAAKGKQGNTEALCQPPPPPGGTVTSSPPVGGGRSRPWQGDYKGGGVTNHWALCPRCAETPPCGAGGSCGCAFGRAFPVVCACVRWRCSGLEWRVDGPWGGCCRWMSPCRRWAM